jgi:hypothetical protein
VTRARIESNEVREEWHLVVLRAGTSTISCGVLLGQREIAGERRAWVDRDEDTGLRAVQDRLQVVPRPIVGPVGATSDVSTYVVGKAEAPSSPARSGRG